MRQLAEIARRFGIRESALAGLRCISEQETVFIGTADVMSFAAVRPMRRGLRLCRVFPHSIKPTTFAMQVIGRQATRNIIDVTGEQASLLINGGELRLDAAVENGFVLLRWQGFIIGVGHYRRPLLRSQIPRIRPVD